MPTDDDLGATARLVEEVEDEIPAAPVVHAEACAEMPAVAGDHVW